MILVNMFCLVKNLNPHKILKISEKKKEFSYFHSFLFAKFKNNSVKFDTYNYRSFYIYQLPLTLYLNPNELSKQIKYRNIKTKSRNMKTKYTRLELGIYMHPEACDDQSLNPQKKSKFQKFPRKQFKFLIFFSECI